MLDSLREEACLKIAKLCTKPDLSNDDLVEQLDSIFERVLSSSSSSTKRSEQHHDDDKGSNNENDLQVSDGGRRSGITPLIIACDKGNKRCLGYLIDKFVTYSSSSSSDAKASADTDSKSRQENPNCVELIGDPVSDISDDVNRNSAIHHAAMAGFHESIQLLHRMMPPSNGYDEVVQSPYRTLGCIRNSHGDTPLMMAASGGHVSFIKRWQELATAQGMTVEEVRKILCYNNDSDDTCLSLACYNGHHNVVECLLSPYCDIPIDSDQVTKCKLSYQEMGAALKSQPSLMKQHKGQFDAVRRCIDAIEETQRRKAEEMANELLAQEATPTNTLSSSGTRNKRKGSSKKKKKQQAKNKSGSVTEDVQPVETADETTDDQVAEDDKDGVQLTTLSDGTVAVRVQGEELGIDHGQTGSDAIVPILRAQAQEQQQPSVNDMFRRRFEEGTRNHGIDAEIDSVMDALCLDLSMLLYTPHGMALNLSPSQLDAIHSILEKQMMAVQEARNIQSRMHTATNQTLDDAQAPPDTNESSN